MLGGRPSTIDPDGDADGDGMLNVTEFVMGTDGADASSVLQLGIRIGPDGKPVIHFAGEGTDRAGTAGVLRFYYLDMMTNLLNDAWHCIGTITNTIDRVIECTNDAPEAASTFYRLRVGLDLPFAPVANAGPDQATTNTTVTLDGSGSSDANGDPLTYVWSTNGVQIATGVRPTVTLPFGAHTVTLTVDDGRSGTDTDTVVIQIAEGLLSVSVDGVAHGYPVLSYAPVVQDGQDGLPSVVEILRWRDHASHLGQCVEEDRSGQLHDRDEYDADVRLLELGPGRDPGHRVRHGRRDLGHDKQFQFYGSQVWGLQDYDDYSGSAPGVKHYTIPVGQFFTGTFKYLTFINDHDVDPPTGVSTFSNIEIGIATP